MTETFLDLKNNLQNIFHVEQRISQKTRRFNCS